jgi:hypothetical protein
MSNLEALNTLNQKFRNLKPSLALFQVLLVLIFFSTFELACVAAPFYVLFRWLGRHV